jgi:hypothetical protein
MPMSDDPDLPDLRRHLDSRDEQPIGEVFAKGASVLGALGRALHRSA